MNTASLDDLLLFVTIVDTGTFTLAAKKLNTPKSKLSRHIAQLEKKLGSQLLIRTTRSQQLTPAGKLLYQASKPHIEALKLVEDEVGVMINEPQGKLDILLPLEFFNRVITVLVSDFAKLYPKISLTCRQYSGDIAEVDFRADLIFVLHETQLPASQWIAKNLMSFPQSIYSASRQRSEHIKVPEDLSMEDCMLSQEEKQWLFRDGNTVRAVDVNGRMTLSSPEMRVAACERDLGIIKLPDYIARQSPKLTKVFLENSPLAQQLSVMYQSRTIPTKTRLFLDYFQSNIGCLSI
ncbi:LysR family transcriptional regulator [Colwelliaceae bacterium 6471]